jgi:HEAT repeat protein
VTDEVIPALLAVLNLERANLKSSHDHFRMDMDREHVVQILGDMGPKAVPAVPALLAKLSDSRLQQDVFEVLSKIGPPPVEVLLEALRSKDSLQRSYAVKLLAKVEPEAAAVAVPELVAQFKDSVYGVEKEVVVVLSRIGPEVEGVLEGLIFAFQMKSSGAQREAQVALAEIGAPAVSPLVELLEAEQDANRRREIISVFYSMGPRAAQAVPALRKASKTEPNPEIRRFLQSTLEQIGSGRPE